MGNLRTLHITTDNQYLLSGYQSSAGARLDIQRIIREPSSVKVASSLPLRLYPNPTSGNIYFEGIIDGMVTVYDGSGRMVLSLREAGSGIEVRHLPPGLYLVRAETHEGIYIGRFVKE